MFYITGKKSKNNGGYSGEQSIGDSHGETFYIPRDTPVKLTKLPVKFADLTNFPFFSEFHWLIDFSVCAVGVYLVNEVAFSGLVPWLTAAENESKPPSFLTSRFNFSLVWCALPLFFASRTLFSLSAIYFNSKDGRKTSDEKATTIETNYPVSSLSGANDKRVLAPELMILLVAAFFFLIASMSCLALDGRFFDFGLANAHANLIPLGSEQNSLKDYHPFISFGAFQALLAFPAAILGALLTFPGLRYARMYLDAVK
ncbi:unnamed protein product [Protopolystoma xenopodis]|uniref:Uncharacterized protein n=1 Tax=Protopolystoma xenopodis TaxID=117903 RepID=A0A3S5CRR4_9PLAT|nr:unnamed protein product [Protopolystoma xenopodis]